MEVQHNSWLTTKLAAAQQYEHTGKWSARFDNWSSRDGESYLISTVTSGAFFDTAKEADEAGLRAMHCLQETGRYPNMCEKF